MQIYPPLKSAFLHHFYDLISILVYGYYGGMKMSAIIIGTQIKSLRKSKGITQRAFASALKVTPQAVSKWERNQSFPDISILPAIADYFGVSMDTLFGLCR